MRITGKRFRKTRFVYTDQLIVSVEVEAVTPEEDPQTPCYECEAVDFMQEIGSHAKAGDIVWIQRHGKVYRAIGAA